jgi:hypothetical protein
MLFMGRTTLLRSAARNGRCNSRRTIPAECIGADRTVVEQSHFLHPRIRW